MSNKNKGKQQSKKLFTGKIPKLILNNADPQKSESRRDKIVEPMLSSWSDKSTFKNPEI